jgi:cytochrome d ubiquinol oxidase subunit II
MHFLDIETLRVLWWVLLGVLLIGFAVTDGYDMGVGALLPVVARTDLERRMVINSVGAHWEGHQAWFILGGGAIFAAWPFVYAVSFSGFYLAMFLVLAAMILRPVGFKYRSKRNDPTWRSRWDAAIFVGSFVPALVFGVAVGNVLLGLPFHFDSDLRAFYDGSFLALFTPFALLCGLLSVAMLVAHGSTWLALKLEPGVVRDRARFAGIVAALASLVLFAAGGVALWLGRLGYAIAGTVDPAGASNPLRTATLPETGAWLANYAAHPALVIVPALGFLGAVIALAGLRRSADRLAFLGSGLSAAGIIGSVGTSMFPFIVPSSVDAHSSLTVWNASSSAHTLAIMLFCTAVFLPLVLAYTTWAIRVMRGRVTAAEIRVHPDRY